MVELCVDKGDEEAPVVGELGKLEHSGNVTFSRL